METYPPGHERVIAVAVGVITDEQDSVLLIQHPDRGELQTDHPAEENDGGHLWFPSGKIKEPDPDNPGGLRDIIRILDTFAAAAFIAQLEHMEMESWGVAVRREVHEELAEEMVPSIVQPIRPSRRGHLIRFERYYDPPVKIFNQRGDGTGYNKPIETESVIFACKTILPPHWMRAFKTAALTDRRICFATEGEIREQIVAQGLRRISPDVGRILTKIGFYSSP